MLSEEEEEHFFADAGSTDAGEEASRLPFRVIVTILYRNKNPAARLARRPAGLFGRLARRPLISKIVVFFLGMQ